MSNSLDFAEAETAFQVAERLRSTHQKFSWEVFGEKLERLEVHLNGTQVELRREPILLEGYGLRLFRKDGGVTRVGLASSSDPTPAGVDATRKVAEATAKYAHFPAKHFELPSPAEAPPGRETVDRTVWEDPSGAVDGYVRALVDSVEGISDVAPSFGSVRATRGQTTIANSEGLEFRFPFTYLELEFAVTAAGGPEGPAPGEFWVNDRARSASTRGLPDQVAHWVQLARDVRRAGSPPSGTLPVLLPPDVLSEILPPVLGYRLSGAAQLRKLAFDLGDEIAAPSVSIYDDGTVPMSVGTAPCDDEGTEQTRRAIIENGKVVGRLYDTLHGGAFDCGSTGNAKRDSAYVASWFHFTDAPAPRMTTMVLSGPSGGTDDELLEGVVDGVWIDQIGFPSPDAVSGSFGGEIRMGYRIRHGKLAEPIKGGTVGGLVVAPPGRPSLLSTITSMGNSTKLFANLKGATCRVEGLTVSGG